MAPPTPQRRFGGEENFVRKGLYGYVWAMSGRQQILLALLPIFFPARSRAARVAASRRKRRDQPERIRFADLIMRHLRRCCSRAGHRLWNIYRNSVGQATSQRLDTFTAALHHPEPDSTAK